MVKESKEGLEELVKEFEEGLAEYENSESGEGERTTYGEYDESSKADGLIECSNSDKEYNYFENGLICPYCDYQ